MLLQLPEHIRHICEGVTVQEIRQTFQNCLVRGRMHDGRAVFVKSYGTQGHYDTERRLLYHLHGVKKAFRTPEPITRHDAERTVVMSALSGEALSISQENDEHIGAFSKVLRDFHLQSHSSHLMHPDILGILRMYVANIDRAEHISSSEQRLAIRLATKLSDSVSDLPLTTSHVVHGDVNAGNILYDPDHQVSYAVIDFERAGIGDGYSDIAKFNWRVLGSDAYLSSAFLTAYLQRKPSERERDKLKWFAGLEYLGAVSYFEYRGHRENYPFKDDAIKHIESCLL